MSSNEVIRSVAKKLKYYFEVKRLEDGFDLSDIHQPLLDHPPLKVRSAHENGVLRDRAVKHYFRQPEARVQLTQLNVKNARGSLTSRREKQVRRMLDNYMKHYSFQEEWVSPSPRKGPSSDQKNPAPSCYHFHHSKGCELQPQSGLNRRKKLNNRTLLGGWPTLKTVPDPYITKGEVNRLVNSATKILAATEIINSLSMTSLREHGREKNGGKKKITAKYSDNYQLKKGRPLKQKPSDDSYTNDESTEDSHRGYSSDSRPRSPTPSHNSSWSTATDTNSHSASTASSTDEKSPRPKSAKFKSRTFINLPDNKSQEEVKVVHSTQTVADYDESEKISHQDSNKLEEEVRHGPIGEYQVYVQTGDRIGAGTKAPIKMIMYGDKGRTKEFTLSKSKRHKITFQRGKEDLFILSAHHIGRVRKIQIGHDRPELNFAWYLEGVTVYDMHAKRIFQFPCERWLSGQDGDKKTYRILQVDREREFINGLYNDQIPVTLNVISVTNTIQIKNTTHKAKEICKNYLIIFAACIISCMLFTGCFICFAALDESMSKSPRSEKLLHDSDSSILVDGSPRKKQSKRNKKIAVVTQENTSSDESDESDREDKTRGTSSSGYSTPRVATKNTSAKNKEAKVTIYSADKGKTGPIITLHSTPDGKKVDEIHMDSPSPTSDTHKKTHKSKPVQDHQEEDKAHVVQSEDDKRRQLERERAMERNMLQGKGIHDAVRAGDLERVKDLLHQFPEMKDFKDGSGWTPLHLAAARGNVEVLRWLVTSDADIDAVTPTGFNAIHIAAMNGHVNPMMFLQAWGLSISSLTGEKQSALHLAAKSGHLECVKWLVANRTSLTLEDSKGRTACRLAEEMHQDACAEFLHVCMKELSNPRSTFSQIHRYNNGRNLPPIEEDATSISSGTQWKEDVHPKTNSSSESEDENKNKKTKNL
ncbi:unnamed protein product [Lymnaea stagnalis]|uniref:PLAT domain-containing protein n=1 Tax=Lymnaea stagnalis TaxID=6523 RepID=A0AAV2I781_LYMST